MGKDVATALGYSNTRKAVLVHVDAEDKGVTKWDTPGGIQEMTIINESGSTLSSSAVNLNPQNASNAG